MTNICPASECEEWASPAKRRLDVCVDAYAIALKGRIMYSFCCLYSVWGVANLIPYGDEEVAAGLMGSCSLLLV